MKNAKNLFAGLLLILSVSAFAKDDSPSVMGKIGTTLTAYINALNHGNIKGLNNYLDASVKCSISAHQRLISMNKSELMEYFQKAENIDQNCKTTYEILESSATQALVKVSQKYEIFTKKNILTLNNTEKGWKITNISTTFEDTK